MTKKIPLKIKKIALFTDIHFGARSNSEQHNNDCLNFLTWFCENVRNDADIDAVGFLGDWNENRSALNVATMNMSYYGAKMLNELNIPIFFVIGNHDLYHRHTREVHSIVPFHEFANFHVIESPISFSNELGHDFLMCPYLFHEEYPDLTQYSKIPVWMGHFEFKGFEVTGYGTKMPVGPDPNDFKDPKYILSGHFHKRQTYENSNIVYIGNTFPSSYGDAGDFNRGMATYDFVNDNLEFHNWDQCPKFIKTKLTDLLDNKIRLPEQSRVKCLIDVPITYEESLTIRSSFIEKYDLREFVMEESPDMKELVSETETKITAEQTKLAGVDELVQIMLEDISSDHIDNDMLITIYQSLGTH